MSRARTLAGAIGSDGALNVADVAGLAAVASSGSASDLSTGTLPNARLASGAAVANLGYTPVNKAGDTFTGKATFGDSSGSVAAIALLNGSADNGTGRTHQMEFGYNGLAEFRHVIKTRHNAGAQKDNAIEVKLWTPSDASTAYGSKTVMTLEGTGIIYMPYQPWCQTRVTGSYNLADGESFTQSYSTSLGSRGGFSFSGGKLIVPATGAYAVVTTLEGSINDPLTYKIRATSAKLRINGAVLDANYGGDRWHSVANVNFSNTHYTHPNQYIVSLSAGDGLDTQTWMYHNKGSNVTDSYIINMYVQFLG